MKMRLRACGTLSTMSREGLEQFRQLVWQDLALQRRLREATGRESFMKLVLSEGERRGCVLTAEDVEEAMRESRRAWLERWL